MTPTIRRFILLSAGLAACAVRAAAAPPPHLELRGARLFVLEDGTPVWRIETAAPAPAEAIRILIDLDGPDTGLDDHGADRMIEGMILYRLTGNRRDWSWDEAGPVPAVRDGAAWTVLFPAKPPGAAIRWSAHTLASDWTVADRFPPVGVAESEVAGLPRLPAPDTRAFPAPDLAPLLAHRPDPLPVRIRNRAGLEAWEPDDEMAGLNTRAWPRPGWEEPLAIRFRLLDASSGLTPEATPDARFRSGSAALWTGRTLDVDWVLLFEPDDTGALRVSLEMESAAERRIRAEIAIRLPGGGWVWHDDPYRTRAFTETAPPHDDGPTTFPFAAVSSPAGWVAAQVEPFEPRVFRFAPDPEGPDLVLSWDAALSPMTTRFPGRWAGAALFRTGSSEKNAFRAAVRHWHEALDPPADGRSAAGEAPVSAGTGRGYARLSPWTVRREWPRGMDRTEAGAFRILQFEAAAHPAPHGFEAASALLAAYRDADGRARARPEGDMAEWTVAAQPDFLTTPGAPWNRVMVLWNDILAALTGNAAGLLVELPGCRGEPDRNRAALAATGHPLCMPGTSPEPGLAAEAGIADLLAPLRGLLREHGRRLALQIPSSGVSFPVEFGDFYLEDATRFPSWDELAVRRMLAGRNPWVLRIEPGAQAPEDRSARSPTPDGPLFWAVGILSPGNLAGRSPAGEALRAAQAWNPVIARLQAAGWNPEGFARVTGPGLRAEGYGRDPGTTRHLTLFHEGPAETAATLQFTDLPGPALLVDLRSGRCLALRPGEDGRVGATLPLPPRATAVLDLVPLDRLEEQLAFLASWNPPGGEARAARDNLASLPGEFEADSEAWLDTPAPGIYRLRVRNLGTDPLIVSGVIGPGEGAGTALGAEPRILGPGETAEHSGAFDESDLAADGWAEARWRLQRGPRQWEAVRRIRPGRPGANREE